MKKTGYNTIIALTTIISFLMGSCLKDEWADEKEQEKINRDAYIKSLENDGYTVIAEDGIYYAVVNGGTGISPSENDYVLINFTGTKTDNTIIETTDANLADDWPYYDYYDHYVFGPKKIYLGSSIPGFIIGLKKMQEGGRSILIIPSELGYWQNEYKTVIYDTELLKVIENPILFDSLLVSSYVSENLNNAVLNNDIYFEKLEPADFSDSLTIEPEDTVHIRFESYYLLEDTLILFESNIADTIPLIFKYSATATAPDNYLPFTKGFLAAIDTMGMGTKAKVLVPYEQGYEEGGYSHPYYDYIIVPDYTSLVYDIEIENIIRQ